MDGTSIPLMAPLKSSEDPSDWKRIPKATDGGGGSFIPIANLIISAADR